MKLCLFIDGLDEFDGDSEEIAELFKAITSPHVKVCLSSRPWVVFRHCFEGLPSLRLEDFTRPDIEVYVNDLLSGNTLFKKPALIHPLETNEFIQEIVEKADGVFLWVAIVVKSLLRGIRNRDSISDMQLRRRRLPKELEPLYGHLLKLIEPEYLPWASKAFQTLITAQQHVFTQFLSDCSVDMSEKTLSLRDLTFAMDDTASIANVQPYKVQSGVSSLLVSRCEDTIIHLTVRCTGLLETWDVGLSLPTAKIHFLHRTARDYILTPSVWEYLVTNIQANNFSPRVSLIRSIVLQISIVPNFYENSDVDNMAFDALAHAVASETSQIKVPPGLLDDLQKEMCSPKQNRVVPIWVSELTKYHGLPDAKSMLPIAAMFGLTSYIESKSLQTRKKLIGDGASLLHYAIPRAFEEAHYVVPPTFLTVEVLLSTCDVNLVYDSMTPWQQALAYVCQRQYELNESEERLQDVKILSIMLKAGADPRVLSVYNGKSYGHYSWAPLKTPPKLLYIIQKTTTNSPQTLFLSKRLEITSGLSLIPLQ